MFAKGKSGARIFRAIYERRCVSKQALADALNLSLPTVTEGLRRLEDEGLVVRAGNFASTGGRPAVTWELVADARFAIGVELVATQARLAAVNLYGAILDQRVEPLAFERTDAYFDRVVELIGSMAAALEESGRRLLGVTVAIQGIVDEEGRVSFGGLLGADDVQVSVDDFGRRMPCPPRFVHDAEAAAYAELWRHRELDNFAYLSLNDHVGSALVFEGKLLKGGPLGAGVVEHMVVHPGGQTCYCGGAGCAETVLGAKALEARAGMSVDAFFDNLRAGDAACGHLWEAYLDELAMLVHNVRMVACCDVVVGGVVARHMNEADIRELRGRAMDKGALSRAPFHLMRGQYGDRATVVGAGLLQVDAFLQSQYDV